jgi:beta-lactam-binding protein with PASTA domain
VASSQPKDIVIAQTPTAGVTAVSGTTVKLTCPSGAKPVVVPQVVGQTQGSAVNALTGVGLKPVLHNVGSSKPAGVVVAQKPAAGKEVDKGSKVTLNVSTGTPSSTTVSTTTPPRAPPRRPPRRRTRTDVGGERSRAARDGSGADAGAAAAERARPAPAGRVQKVRPAGEPRCCSNRPSAARRCGATRLSRSSCRPGRTRSRRTPVPNVVGQDQATAANNIKTRGLQGRRAQPPVTSQSKDGIVVDEQPRAGSGIPAGSLVTIFVGRFSGG